MTLCPCDRKSKCLWEPRTCVTHCTPVLGHAHGLGMASHIPSLRRVCQRRALKPNCNQCPSSAHTPIPVLPWNRELILRRQRSRIVDPYGCLRAGIRHVYARWHGEVQLLPLQIGCAVSSNHPPAGSLASQCEPFQWSGLSRIEQQQFPRTIGMPGPSRLQSKLWPRLGRACEPAPPLFR